MTDIGVEEPGAAPYVRPARFARLSFRQQMLGFLRRPGVATGLAVGWLLLAALAYLAPTLLHGTKLGSQDLLDQFGLGAIPGVQPHNPVASDQIQEMMPWAALSWSEVHRGHFPLWNPYSGFGMPLFPNFVSASMSLPMLVSYLAPERFVYTIEVIAKLLIAGTGVLWMCRRVRLRLIPSTLAATAFMLSGSFTGWLGWPMSGTMAWLGWAIGATILIVRDQRGRFLHVAGLAVALAFAVYAGHPETFAIVVICIVIVAVAALADLLVKTRDLGSLLRPTIALTGAGFAAAGLAAPLLLPGLQIVTRAARTSVRGYPLPAKSSVNLLFASYGGLPTRGSQYFGAVDYYETAAYVGLIVIALAVVCLLLRHRDHVVLSLAAICVVCGLLTYSAHVSTFLDKIPAVKNLQWTRALTALDFALCVLAGFGLQSLVDRHRERITRWAFASVVAGAALLTGGLWIRQLSSHMPALADHIRTRSFIWPAIDLLVLAVAAMLLFLPGHRFQLRPAEPRLIASPFLAGGLLLFAGQVAFLLTATPHLWSSSARFFPTTPAEEALQRDVGTARIGFNACPSILDLPNLGILTEANDAYQVSEASAYDGTVPRSYFTSYFAAIGKPVPADTGFGQFCPSMTDASVARHFGVGYILGMSGTPQPNGTTLVATISNENLYTVPGAGVVTLEPDLTAPDSPMATVAQNLSNDPSHWRIAVSPTEASTMYVHITDLPGWRATLDGRAIALRKWGGTMWAANIPRGHHLIVISYAPTSFTMGMILAAVTALILLAGVGGSQLRQRRWADQVSGG